VEEVSADLTKILWIMSSGVSTVALNHCVTGSNPV